eukprot:3537630-Amphidinium_carterae.1
MSCNPRPIKFPHCTGVPQCPFWAHRSLCWALALWGRQSHLKFRPFCVLVLGILAQDLCAQWVSLWAV